MIAEPLLPLAVDITTLTTLEKNPRRGEVKAIMRSLERFGQRKPIVALPNGTVIAGNHTLMAARELGWDEIAVTISDDDPQTAKAFALADNRTGDLGTYDEEILAELLVEVSDDPELLLATGYTPDDVDELLGSLDIELDDAGPSEDEPVPTSAPAKTIKGDIWLLGPHRLMCGDSTVPTDVERLMAGAKADMVWTDPPYGVNYVGGTRDSLTIQNDALGGDEFLNLLHSAFLRGLAATRPGACWFVAATPAPPLRFFTQVLSDLGIWRQTLVWVKDSLVMGLADYHYRYEIIFYGWTPGAAHNKSPDRTTDNVWEIPRPKRSEEHPTMKPVALVEKSITRHTKTSDVVLDMFGGSGTTLIAAQQTGRIAYLMELDEHYCDIICARFQRATGIKPIHEATGNEHDFLAE